MVLRDPYKEKPRLALVPRKLRAVGRAALGKRQPPLDVLEDRLRHLQLLAVAASLGDEWRAAGEQLKEQRAERPPVGRERVALPSHLLGRKVLKMKILATSATRRKSLCCARPPLVWVLAARR